jgi:hypothetical protein
MKLIKNKLKLIEKNIFIYIYKSINKDLFRSPYLIKWY